MRHLPGPLRPESRAATVVDPRLGALRGLRPMRRGLGTVRRRVVGSAPSLKRRLGRAAAYWWARFYDHRDRVVALSRAVFALGCALAASVAIEALHPEALVFWIYAAVSALLAAAAWQREPSVEFRLAATLADLLAFTALLHASEGESAALLAVLALALVATAVVSGWRWLLGLSLAYLVLLLAPAALSLVTGRGAIELTEALQLAWLPLTATALTALALGSPGTPGDGWRLGASPAVRPPPAGWPVGEVLEYVARVLQIPRVLLVWSDEDEPWSQLSLWQDGKLAEAKAAPDRFEPWVAEPLAEASFLTFDATIGDALVKRGAGVIERWHGLSVHPRLADAYSMGVAISVPIPVPRDALSARLFLLDGQDFSRDTLVIAEVLAARVAGMFEEARLMRELRRAAAAAERLRLARDLHDGLLQALAGASLQLRTLHGVIREDPERAVERLTAIEEALTSEQRALRHLIRSAQPTGDLRVSDEASSVAARLHALIERLQRRWQVEIVFKLTPEEIPVSASMEHDLTQILSEAVANAARHGGATRVTIDLHAVSGVIRTIIQDNGCGFPFVGSLDENALEREKLGPRSLRERVTGRGGRITVDSRLGCARLEIVLPRGRVTG